ncbi:MAG: oxygen-independent coproporphyrinogen III oxidase [Candidatus Latescibacterota bacterium]|nr:oxygen-independent coproporphyrinogen III oxidase [Candidatus Latescibacterota bacterium]
MTTTDLIEGRAAAGIGPCEIDPELLARYDRPGPRYTSYPTAVEFHEGFTSDDYAPRLRQLDPDEAISLYLHLPFCDYRCHFCGCHVVATRKPDVAQRYMDYLRREMELVAGHIGHRATVSQYHWGGGTPTYYGPEQLRQLHDWGRQHFDIIPEAELGIEVDPRVTTHEHIVGLRELGFNRISMGVQDFDPYVQEAIGRRQMERQTQELYQYCRDAGFASINIDLVYGLPGQRYVTFARTLRTVTAMRPDRLAVYSYAHVPWVKGNQQRIDESLLPDRNTKFELFASAISHLREAGYKQIGMDHFALPDDELATALQQRCLHRNFMGYTVQKSSIMVGLGISAIGDVGSAFVQNHKKLSTYYDEIDAGELPLERGFALSEDDKLRRHVILELMCNLHLDFKLVESRFEIDFSETFATELAELAAGPAEEGLVDIDNESLRVTARGQLLLRNVCMIFDRYLREKVRKGPTFSRTV